MIGNDYRAYVESQTDALYHFGVKGQKWGHRRFQNADGSLTPEGKMRYLQGDSAVTRRVKNDWNSMDDRQFMRKYQTSKKRYLKRVQKYGDPYKHRMNRINTPGTVDHYLNKTGNAMLKRYRGKDGQKNAVKDAAAIGLASAGIAGVGYGGAALASKIGRGKAKRLGSNLPANLRRVDKFRNSAKDAASRLNRSAKTNLGKAADAVRRSRIKKIQPTLPVVRKNSRFGDAARGVKNAFERSVRGVDSNGILRDTTKRGVRRAKTIRFQPTTPAIRGIRGMSRGGKAALAVAGAAALGAGTYYGIKAYKKRSRKKSKGTRR